MILILGAQRDLGVTQKFITQISDCSNLPPKSGLFFSDFDPKGPQRYLSLSEDFLKTLRVFQFCVWTGRSGGFIASHVDTRDAQTKCLKTVCMY